MIQGLHPEEDGEPCCGGPGGREELVFVGCVVVGAEVGESGMGEKGGIEGWEVDDCCWGVSLGEMRDEKGEREGELGGEERGRLTEHDG